MNAACRLAWRLAYTKAKLEASERHVIDLSAAFNRKAIYADRIETECKEIAHSRAEWITRWKEGEFQLRGATIVPEESDLERF